MVLAQAVLDELWDFDDPAGSEVRLRGAAEAARSGAERGELLTQVARSLGLQGRFGEADAVLDAIDSVPLLPDGVAIVRARVELERGRLRNSSGEARAAVPLFREAADLAARAGSTFLEVDALHMLAIADPAHGEAWTQRGLDVLGTVSDGRTLRWRVSLHNNAGWALLDEGRPREALVRFEAARAAAVQWGTERQVVWADAALAECRAALDSSAG